MTKVQAELDETKIILVKYPHKLRPNTLIYSIEFNFIVIHTMCRRV